MHSFSSISIFSQVQMLQLLPWANYQAWRVQVLYGHRQVQWENVWGGKGGGMHHRASRLCCMLPWHLGPFNCCHWSEDQSEEVLLDDKNWKKCSWVWVSVWNNYVVLLALLILMPQSIPVVPPPSPPCVLCLVIGLSIKTIFKELILHLG